MERNTYGYRGPEGFKLDPELKSRWLEALDSGKFKRGVGRLKETLGNGEVRHCCLGVANEVFRLCRGASEWGLYATTNGVRSYIFLPGNIQSQLADINDNSEYDGYEDPIRFITENL